MPSTTEHGRDAEDRAVAFLKTRGYRIVQRNVRVPGGEIDAVCLDGKIVVFVEIKSRTTARFGGALEAVDARKRGRLRRVAADYAQFVAPQARLRFDVVAVDGERISLHRNAF
jgi:putative endonuclease